MNRKQMTFRDVFGTDPAVSVSVPGRVNLIGEHIDYTGGMVLPMPIARLITVDFAPGGDAVSVYSCRFDERIEGNIEDSNEGHWSAYVLAAHRKAVAEGLIERGGQYFIDADIPHGAGVSSSAALLVAILMAAAKTDSEQEIDAVQIALWAQQIENEDIGVPCGIMDQMAVAVGKPGFALSLQTDTLEMELIALPAGYAFPVFHSGLTRQLVDGAYRERREACERAARLLGTKTLSQISDVELETSKSFDDPINRRTRHVVTEHRRALEAVDALKSANMMRFGALMNESHKSMRDDFEIIPSAMEEMCAYARSIGALGSRLTGGGFGGCFVSLVPADQEEAWTRHMQEKFPDIWLVSCGSN